MVINKTGKLSLRELFLIESALYWAEGDKKQRQISVNLSFGNKPNLPQQTKTY